MKANFLEGKSALVTGSGGGIGREIALAMARAGAKVVVNDVGSSVHGEGQDDGPAQQTVNEIKAAGGEAVANTDSVAGWDSAHRIVQCALDNFGRIDVVVNNAGILRDRMFHRMNAEEFQAVIGVHLMGSFYVARAAAPHFREQKSGSFIHMTSNSGLLGGIGQTNYAAAKLAIVALSKNIAMEMHSLGIRSNCISPSAYSRMIGAIPTDTPEAKAKVERMQTSLHPNKIAPLACYLASDEAKDVNAQVFYVRANELFVYSQPRPIRSVHRAEGWTAQSLHEHGIPALRKSFVPMDTVGELYPWDPI
ncbi:MAG TPA: SDR family NAD(P)-dependent oxidoreductase [Ramlibacter sp.]|nr:SDR family NAD(P)-dependent oxidoreductase [Ramlibacter sp.]